MISPMQTQPPRTSPNPPFLALRCWLIFISIAAVLLALLAVIFGLLVNMDTKIEMNPLGDPLARQDAVGFRLFAWGGALLFILLQAAGVLGAWRAFSGKRYRAAFGLSLLVAVPVLLLAVGFIVAVLRSS